MKLKLIGDGTSYGTKIINVETGEELKNIISVKVEIQGGHIPIMTLEVIPDSYEITAKLNEVAHAGGASLLESGECCKRHGNKN